MISKERKAQIACLTSEVRQTFHKLLNELTAKYRPADDSEMQIVREIADYHWKSMRNKQMETAIFNRELIRQAHIAKPSIPELRDLEISIATQEALTGNRTIIELRKDTQGCLRAINQLQRRLRDLQKYPAPAGPVPPAAEQSAVPKDDAQEAVNRYRQIFQTNSIHLVRHKPLADPRTAAEACPKSQRFRFQSE
jgi:hypothetical protein